jgi:hypothetical protein
MTERKLDSITNYLHKYQDSRMLVFEYILYLGEELIKHKDFNIFDTTNHSKKFMKIFDLKEKLDTEFIDELLNYSNQVVDNSELRVIKNTSIYLHISSDITFPFLILSVAYICLFDPDILLLKKGVIEYERYVLSFYHSLGKDTFVILSSYVPQGEHKAQFGLYAKRDFKKGEKVSYFYGDIKSKSFKQTEKVCTKYICDYNIHISKDKLFYISIKSPIEANARYANCALKKKDINAKISCNPSKDGKKMNIIAIKNISVGDEILTDYGDEYKEAIISGDI